jgi:hypothetical protein
MVGVAVTAIAVGVAALLGSVGTPTPAGPNGVLPSVEPVIERTPAPDVGGGVTSGQGSVGDASPAALRRAGAWARAWVRPAAGTSDAEWLARQTDFVTEEYLAVLGTVDPQNIASTAVIGPPRAIRVTEGASDVLVPTDGRSPVVTMVEREGRWLVAGYRPSTAEEESR